MHKSGEHILQALTLQNLKLSLCILILNVAGLMLGRSAAALDRSMLTPILCNDDLVDVQLNYFTGNDANSVPVDPPPGRPQLHLRLPRSGLQLRRAVNEPIRVDNCSQVEFVAAQAFYLYPDNVARRLGLAYEERWTKWDNLRFYIVNTANLPLVNDATDREATARQGEWIIDTDARPSGAARFCLNPPAPPKHCYISVFQGRVSYYTGNLGIGTRPFYSMTLHRSLAPNESAYTVVDLDQYFAFLRALANAVIIQAPVTNIQTKD